MRLAWLPMFAHALSRLMISLGAARRARRRAEGHMRALAELGRVLGPCHTSETMLAEASRLVRRTLGSSEVSFAVLDRPARPPAADVLASCPAVLDLLRSGGAVVCADVARDRRVARDAEALRRAGVAAFVCVPVMHEGTLIAVLSASQATPRRWRGDEVQFLERAAERSWLAVERTRLGEAGMRSERVLQKVLDHAPIIIYLKDATGRLLLVNREFAELAGRPVDDIIGKFDHEIFADPRVDEFVANDRQTFARGERSTFEEALALPDGVHSYLSVKLLASDLGFGGPVLCGFSTDVTELKNAQLRLVEADRRKDEFLAMLAHELRNPLAPLRLAVESLRQPRLDPSKAARLYDIIDRQVDNLSRIVDDLLDVARITRGRIELHREASALGVIVSRAIDAVQPLADAAKHELVATLPAAPVVSVVDPVRLEQVVVNLLTNAVKYTPRGGRIAVCLGAEVDSAVIAVRDNGVGIPADMLPRIFDLFQQGRTDLERAKGGLGIGLTIVRQLVALHGGTIEARSAGAGLGAEFLVRLPLAPAVPEPPRPPAPPPVPAARRLSILAVDDNRDVTTALKEMLERMGHVVLEAADAETALTEVEGFRPDLAILDIGLPGMDGYDLARALRARLGARPTLVALSGYGQARDRQRSREAGFDTHLVKPLRPEDLTALVSDVAAREVASPTQAPRAAD